MSEGPLQASARALRPGRNWAVIPRLRAAGASKGSRLKQMPSAVPCHQAKHHRRSQGELSQWRTTRAGKPAAALLARPQLDVDFGNDLARPMLRDPVHGTSSMVA